MFPEVRMRRLRRYPWLREMVEDVTLTPKNLVLPIFVKEKHLDKKIPGMPGVERYDVSELPTLMRELVDLGIPAVALFPMIEEKKKDERGTEALNPEGLIPQAIREIRSATRDIGIITDIALDPYTSHGQDGVVQDGEILNDETVKILSQKALVLARAGADIVAPSDMMDGRIGVIREALETNDFQGVSILSYAAKYASNFYGPFRHAVGSINCLGKADKNTYQMSFKRKNEALAEIMLDEDEGADMLMVKPATVYMDIIHKVSENTELPVFAYHVSGEYACLKLAAEAGAINFEETLLETCVGIRRAGAQGIFTYGARLLAEKMLK